MRGQIVRLIKQARQMQENIKKAQEQLTLIEVEGVSGVGLMKVVVAYKNNVKCVSINPSLLAEDEDKDLFEDLIAAAFSDTARKAETTTQERMNSLTSDLGGVTSILPPGFKLSF